MKKIRFPAKKIAVLALLTALGLIVFVIENQFPPLFVPGAKMGLANIFSLAALILYGPTEAFFVVVVRTVLGSLFAGNISMLLYSLTGGVVSLAVSSLLVYLIYPRISVMAVSIAAAVVHNIVQYTVYVLVSATPEIFMFLPYSALIGILSGAIVGAVVAIVFKKVPQSVFVRAAFDNVPKHGAEQSAGDEGAADMQNTQGAENSPDAQSAGAQSGAADEGDK